MVMVNNKHCCSPSTSFTMQRGEKILSQDHRSREDGLVVLMTGQGAKKSLEVHRMRLGSGEAATTTVPEAQKAWDLRDQIVSK